AEYAWTKARDASEKAIPERVDQLRDKIKKSLGSAGDSYADKIASTEFKKANEAFAEAEEMEAEASKMLRTYPSREGEVQQNVVRSMAFEKYDKVIAKLLEADKRATHAKSIALSQSPQILDSTTDIEKNLAISEKYIKLQEPAQPELSKQLQETRSLYESALGDVKSGMIKSGVEKLDRSRKDSEILFTKAVVPYAEKRLALAKTKIDSAEKYSFHKDIIDQDETLQELYKDFEDKIGKAKEKFDSANENLTSKAYETSIADSDESIKYAENALTKAIALYNRSNEVADRLAREEELKKQRELEEKRRREEAERQKNLKPETKVVWKKYRVKKDNTLWKIAQYHSMYRKATDWKKIYTYNKAKIRNPNLIYPDQILRVPVKVKVLPPKKKDPCPCDNKDKKEDSDSSDETSEPEEDSEKKTDDSDEDSGDDSEDSNADDGDSDDGDSEESDEDGEGSDEDGEESDEDGEDSEDGSEESDDEDDDEGKEGSSELEESLPGEKEDDKEGKEDRAPSDANTVDPGGN
ncbi:MAG: LysM peptidoglycan-binding domain-containing protein, partial [Spirochaetota bacterium]